MIEQEFNLKRIDNGWLVEGLEPGKDKIEVFCRTIESALEFIRLWIKEDRLKARKWLSPSITKDTL